MKQARIRLFLMGVIAAGLMIGCAEEEDLFTRRVRDTSGSPQSPSSPSTDPSLSPSQQPTTSPTKSPSAAPTKPPTAEPTLAPLPGDPVTNPATGSEDDTPVASDDIEFTPPD